MLHDIPIYLPIKCQTSTYLPPTNLPMRLLTYYVLVYLCTTNYQLWTFLSPTYFQLTHLFPTYLFMYYQPQTYLLTSLSINYESLTYLGTYSLISCQPPTYLSMMNLLSMKQCSLFCLSCRDLPNHCASCHTLDIFKKLSMSRGASNWFETFWRHSVEDTDYWTIFFMKIKQNQSWKLHWNLGVFLVLLESLQRVRFNRLYFTIFRANKM
jgi:hypothetical protein